MKIFRDYINCNYGVWVVNPYDDDSNTCLFIFDLADDYYSYWLFDIDDEDVEKFGSVEATAKHIFSDLYGKYSTYGTSGYGYRKGELIDMFEDLQLNGNLVSSIVYYLNKRDIPKFKTLDGYSRYIYCLNKYDLVDDLIEYEVYEENDRKKLMRLSKDDVKNLHYAYFFEEA